MFLAFFPPLKAFSQECLWLMQWKYSIMEKKNVELKLVQYVILVSIICNSIFNVDFAFSQVILMCIDLITVCFGMQV